MGGNCSPSLPSFVTSTPTITPLAVLRNSKITDPIPRAMRNTVRFRLDCTNAKLAKTGGDKEAQRLVAVLEKAQAALDLLDPLRASL